MSKFYLNRYILLIIIAILFSLNKSNASHIIGGQMTYECLGPDPNMTNHNLYSISMNIYRDCENGISGFDGSPTGAFPATVSVFLGNGNSIMDLSLYSPTISLLDPLEDPCVSQPPNICVEEGVYTFELSLEVVDEPYTITYSRCCRNSTITNIVNPEETGATFTTSITAEGQSSCNNSPVFSELPPPIICLDYPLTLDFSATDAEGDELTYELCSPLIGGGNTSSTSLDGVAPNPDAPPPYDGVTFIGPTYSATNPIGGTPPLSIDPNTGLLTGFPDIQGQFVVGVCIKEYRNGQLLSIVQRDFQFNITTCIPTLQAVIDAPVFDDIYQINSCNENLVEINNLSTGNVPNLDYTWYFDLGNNITSISSYDLSYTFPGAGTYPGFLVAGSELECSDTAFINVIISPELVADFQATYDSCIAAPIILENLSTNGNWNIFQTEWKFGNGTGSSEYNTEVEYTTPGEYDVQIIVTDSIYCTDSLTIPILWYPAPNNITIQPDQFEGCSPLEINFANSTVPIDDETQFFWEFGDGQTSDLVNPSHTFTSGQYNVFVSTTSPVGCVLDTIYENLITVFDTPVALFDWSPNPTNLTPHINFINHTAQSQWWEWSIDGELVSFDFETEYSFDDIGLHQVQLVVMNASQCLDTLVQLIDVKQEVTFFMPNAFSPNYDGKNEVYKGTGQIEGINNFSLSIWNRWGELVFQTKDPLEGWNGRKFNTRDHESNGVYTYTVEYLSPDGNHIHLKGNMMLLR